ncbi:helix-turn-helix domain-containing protein [Cystobacter ferrugineus]|uniref:Transcriptional regulator n=1 Tax=Cystobacter ferrugineus TaxID=83449 RepID=A0A1L9ATP0_9BACT|nr:helix-turn-helix transcriptional regulator [Cystobacter ferrugineus]OJH33388.1 transcriptional regulator [Cystobacter ferrugineus]
MAHANKKKAPLATQVGTAAREARLRAGLTQEELAERAELATEVYGRLERGLMLPSLPSLLRLCRVLRVDANTLLGFSTEKPPAWLVESPPASSEPPALRRLLRTARLLTPKQLTVLGNAAQAMVPPRRVRPSRAAKPAEH